MQAAQLHRFGFAAVITGGLVLVGAVVDPQVRGSKAARLAARSGGTSGLGSPNEASRSGGTPGLGLPREAFRSGGTSGFGRPREAFRSGGTSQYIGIVGFSTSTGSGGTPSGGSGGTPAVLVPPGSVFSVRVVKTARLPAQLGALAYSASRVARGLDDAIALVDPLGDLQAEQAPKGWPRALPAGTKAMRLPLGSRRAGRPCSGCGTEISDTASERVSALYAHRTFVLSGPLPQRLTLRMRYRDGAAVYINGREVARRNLELSRSRMALRRRGPEWESFRITVTPGLLHPGNNQLAIEVRPSKYLTAPILDVELRRSTGVDIVRGPMVQRVTPTAAVIRFDTSTPCTAHVEVETPVGTRSFRSASGALASKHRVALTGLVPGGRVRYGVALDGHVGPEHSFHAARNAGEPQRFIVYGDMRGGHRTHAKIVASIAKQAPDFVIVTGDLVLRGSDNGDWQRFFGVAQPLLATIPYYPAVGNHDMGRAGDEHRRVNELFELWPGPKTRPAWAHWYGFDVGDTHFIMLDSNAYTRPEQLAWVAADLAQAKARGAKAIFAVTHDGPYSRGLHRGNQYAVERYVPLLVKGGVRALFSGHDHLYQRGYRAGLNYIVTGGGGAPLYAPRCGVRGKRRCKYKDGMKHIVAAHHYVVVSVVGKRVEVCPKRVDGSPLETCRTLR